MVAKPSQPPLKNTDEEIIALCETWLTAFEKTQSATGDEEEDATLALARIKSRTSQPHRPKGCVGSW